MRAQKMRRSLTVVFLLALSAIVASAQQIAFTSRAHLTCPVAILAFDESKAFGFDSVVLRNDSEQPLDAVRLKVLFRTEAGDELVDGGRIVVHLEPKESKRVSIGLGQIVALRQKAKASRQTAALAVISVETVERSDGSVWSDSGPAQGEAPVPDIPLLK
jgi:hypothetical protein